MNLVPEKIKNLLATGQAAFKTHVVGMSGSSLIGVGKDTVTIIVGLKYFHFLDIAEAEFRNQAAPFSAVYDRSVTQINIKSPKSKNHYIVRDNIVCTRLSSGAGTVNQWQVNGETNFNCFLVHEDNIQIEIVKTPPAANQAVAISDVAAATIQKSPPPEGYGNATQPTAILQPVQINASIPDNYSHVPLSVPLQGNPAGLPISTNSAKFPVNATTALVSMDNSGAYKSRAYPILNVDMIEIRKPIWEKLQSSI